MAGYGRGVRGKGAAGQSVEDNTPPFYINKVVE